LDGYVPGVYAVKVVGMVSDASPWLGENAMDGLKVDFGTVVAGGCDTEC
jgi:hypothetical protein